LTDEAQLFQSYDHDVAFPSLAGFLQRVTMNAPVVAFEVSVLGRPDGGAIVEPRWITEQLLPGPSEVKPSLLAQYGSVELAGATDALIEPAHQQFMTEFLPWVWDWPTTAPERRLVHYEALLSSLQSIAQPRKSFRERLVKMVQRRQVLDVEGHEYHLPASTLDLELTEPAEVARLLLAGRWQTDAQAVKEIVARLRRERDIGLAWYQYSTWLDETPDVRGQIRGAICGTPVVVAWPAQWQAPASPS